MSERIYFGTIKEGIEPPNLIEVQLNSYLDFLQKDVPFSKRKISGLQAVFKPTAGWHASSHVLELRQDASLATCGWVDGNPGW